MTIGIEGFSYLEVTLDDKKLPLEVFRFQEILISSHILFHLPMGHLHFVDPFDILSKVITPADGLKLSITMGRDSGRTKTYACRTFNIQAKQTKDGVEYYIPFLFDCEKWLSSFAAKSYKSTSNEAIKTIAEECGLKVLTDTTGDEQVWLPLAETPCKFARRIASVGYIDDNSCMLMGVTLEKELRYYNLSSISFKGELPNFIHGSESGVWCSDWSFNDSAGMHNRLGGYATKTTQYKIEEAKNDSRDKVTSKRIANTMNVNKDLKGEVGDGRRVVMPIDGGNVHKKALNAKHQNGRVKQLLSSSVSLLTPLDPKVQLLDPVYFTNYLLDKHEGQVKKDEATSGPYLVVGKAIFMGSDLIYAERYQLIRDGFSKDTTDETT